MIHGSVSINIDRYFWNVEPMCLYSLTIAVPCCAQFEKTGSGSRFGVFDMRISPCPSAGWCIRVRDCDASLHVNPVQSSRYCAVLGSVIPLPLSPKMNRLPSYYSSLPVGFLNSILESVKPPCRLARSISQSTAIGVAVWKGWAFALSLSLHA